MSTTATKSLRRDPSEVEPWAETCGQIRPLIDEEIELHEGVVVYVPRGVKHKAGGRLTVLDRLHPQGRPARRSPVGVTRMMRPTPTLIAAVMACLALASPGALADGPKRPEIRKLGTIDLDMVEATPVVFKDRLYRFEYVRKDHKINTTGDTYFRFLDVATGKPTPAFAHGYDLGCAYAEGGSMWAFGVDQWDGTKVVGFRSGDLEHWEAIPALELPGWGLFNTSVCKAGDRYVMAIEVGRPPEVVGVP